MKNTQQNIQNVITFSGDNSKLFCRVNIDDVAVPKLTLLVPETHNAILIKDGQMLQTLSSGKYLFSKFVDTKNDAEADVEVLFMSKTAKLKMLWGTPQMFLVNEPLLEENYKVGMSGDFDVQIGDPRKCYLYLVGANQNLTSDELQERLVLTIVSVLENETAEYVQENQVSFNKLTVKKREISARVLSKINQKLMTDYGISVFTFNIANIIIDQTDYQRMIKLKKGEAIEQNQTQTQQTETKSTFCENCGNKLSPGAKFCDNCGEKVKKANLCNNCGYENSASAKFCSNCGNKL